MPSIVDLSITCPSNCSLMGTSAIMRDFLLSKNLPDIPTDIIIAGLSNEWYNDGNLATFYENFDPQSLVDPGNVLSIINTMRAQHANLNLYDDYSDEHYNSIQDYTQYPLISIDDSAAAVTILGFGNIEAWTDMDTALIQVETWDGKWDFELITNRYYPGHGYYNIPSLTNHSDNIIQDISILTTDIISQFTTTNYNISSFIMPDNSTVYIPLSYYQQLLELRNKYKQTPSGSYASQYFGVGYFDYALPTLQNPSLDINPNDDDIDTFSDQEGLNVVAFPTATPVGVREWYTSLYNDYSILTTYNPSGLGSYVNGNIGFFTIDNQIGFLPNNDLKDNRIDTIDNFIVNLPNLNELDFIEGEPISPVDIRASYCAYENIFGGSPQITEDVAIMPSDAPEYQYNTTPKTLNCYSYIGSIVDPFSYGIQDARAFFGNILHVTTLVEESVPPQTTINVSEGTPMDLSHFGISDIQSTLGFVFPLDLVPLDAILNQIDQNVKDTPLGKTGKIKLASEFFNRISLNLRNEAYGLAENVTNEIQAIAGNLIRPLAGDNSINSSDRLNEIADIFKSYEITVPKTIIGKAAELVSALGGVNLRLDIIKEDIAWTTNVEKTEEEEDSELNNDTDGQTWWSNLINGLSNNLKNETPSNILLAYTSKGQRDILFEHLLLNEYTPYYEFSNFLDNGKLQRKLQRKKERLEKQIKKDKEKIADLQRQIELSETYINVIKAYTVPYPKTIEKIVNSKNCTPEEAKKYLIEKEEKNIEKLKNKINRLEKDKNQKNTALNIIDEKNKWYPEYDNGTFDGVDSNSVLKSINQLYDSKDIKKIHDIGSVVTSEKYLIQEPMDGNTINKSNSFSRYRKDRVSNLTPETKLPDNFEPTNNNIYYQVFDLVKHGVKVDYKTNVADNLRGLNLRSEDGTNVGYNIYPMLESGGHRLHHPGLGREDIYAGQSLFSVLESNGFVKISPLWDAPDQTASIKKQREIIDGGNKDQTQDYIDKVKLQRYMFSIENLAWKDYNKNLPWWERGPNGGRLMWFPPYDLRVTDTTSVSWGQENLIGRSEPVYTYNHTERSGVLSFKMIIDFPGYHFPTTCEQPKTEPIQATTPDVTIDAEPQIAPLAAPVVNYTVYDVEPDTLIYIIMDYSESMIANNQTIKDLFIGDNCYFKTELLKNNNYTEDQYNNQVFVFEDPGLYVGSPVRDNIDDGRFFSWFAFPYFNSISADTTINTFTYTPNGLATTTYSASKMGERLKANLKSNNLAALNAVTAANKVIVIAVTNEAHPAYLAYNPNTTEINYGATSIGGAYEPTGSLYSDLSDYLTAKNNYNKFKGIILGYDANNSTDPRDRTSNDIFNIFVSYLIGGINPINATGSTTTNNLNVTTNGINYENQSYSLNWQVGGNISGDFAPSTFNVVPNTKELENIFYQLDIGAPGGINATTTGGMDAVDNIVYVIRKALAVNSENNPSVITNAVTSDHDSLPKLRDYMKRMAYNHPNHNTVTETMVFGSAGTNQIATTNVDVIVGPNGGKSETYDIEFFNLLFNGYNTQSRQIEANENVYITINNNGVIETVSTLEWIQQISNNGLTTDGSITSDGWKNILKVIDPASLAVASTSTDKNGNTTNINDKPKSEQIPYGFQNCWCIEKDETETNYNELNEFWYFKRLEQTDSIYNDTFKEKIKFFDPAFHSITPVGFNNRLSFLEQCGRQGPSINNLQFNGSDKNILAANSNLAFGRPPIAVLRIGDFYYTRIAIEGIDLSYEPLLFDLNPEGIGVQPMLCDVTINFKYIGGSSLSGPITKLQNAVSTNYFANEEFYHCDNSFTKSLHAFDRYKYEIPIAPPQPEFIETVSESNEELFYETPLSENITVGDNTGGTPPNIDNNTPICPEGSILVQTGRGVNSNSCATSSAGTYPTQCCAPINEYQKINIIVHNHHQGSDYYGMNEDFVIYCIPPCRKPTVNESFEALKNTEIYAKSTAFGGTTWCVKRLFIEKPYEDFGPTHEEARYQLWKQKGWTGSPFCEPISQKAKLLG